MNVKGWGRLLPEDLSEQAAHLDTYRAQGGYEAWQAWAKRPSAEFIDLVTQSGLRGRGGASFPTGRKMASVAAGEAPRYMVVNGEEGEPASRKDRTLMEVRPHLVLEGALLAGYAVRSEAIYLYLAQEFEEAKAALENAITEAKAASLINEDLEIRFHIVKRNYVAGEETAALNAIEGKAAKPRFKPPLPFVSGLFNRPTLVQNVETVANLPLIGLHGVDWFREVGTQGSPGTVLLTVDGAVQQPGVYEVPLGTSLREVIEECAGGVTGSGTVMAVLPGGYFSGWLDPSQLDLPLDYDTLRGEGSSLGSGSVVVIDTSRNFIRETEAILKFFAIESCRQCGACYMGTDAMQKLASSLLTTTDTAPVLEKLRYYSETLVKHGACAHLDGAALFTRSALNRFVSDLKEGAALPGSEESIITEQIRKK